MYCPDEECGPDEQECIVIYNGSDHYNSTAINATLQVARNESGAVIAVSQEIAGG